MRRTLVAFLSLLAVILMAAFPTGALAADSVEVVGGNRVVVDNDDVTANTHILVSESLGEWEFLWLTGTAPATAVPPCAETGTNEITCSGLGTSTFASGFEIRTGSGDDQISATSVTQPMLTVTGAGFNVVIAGSGNDTLNGSTGADAETLNYLSGGPGSDEFIGGAGRDYASYFYETDPGPSGEFTLSMDCVNNDGGAADASKTDDVGCSTNGMDGIFGSQARDVITGDAGPNLLQGHNGNDVIDGGAGADTLKGHGDADDLTGGTGADALYGDSVDDGNISAAVAGADTLRQQDGEVDTKTDCGDATDTALVDPNDTHIACETVTGVGTAIPDEDGDSVPDSTDNCRSIKNGDQHDHDSDGKGDPCDPYDMTKSSTMPDFRPKKPKKSWKFTELDDARKALDKTGVNLDVTVVKVKLSKVTPSEIRESIDDGDVFRQLPAPGTALASDNTPPFPKVTLLVYDEALDYQGKTCPYGDRKALKAIFRGVQYEELGAAQDFLRSKRCTVRITAERQAKAATDTRVISASLISRKTRTGRDLAIALVIERPLKKDFAINLTSRPNSDWKENPGERSRFRKEIGPGTDGALTGGRNSAVVHLDIYELRTGRLVRNLEVEISNPATGKVLASTKTTNAGGLTFSMPVDFTGELDVHVRFEAKGSNGFEVLESWQSIKVVDRQQKPFYEANGRYFTWDSKNGMYVQTKLPPTPSEVMARVEGTMEGILCGSVSRVPGLAQACGVLTSTAGTPQSRVADLADLNVVLGKLGAGSTYDSTLNLGEVSTQPLFSIAPTGVATPGFSPGLLLPATGDVAAVTLISDNGSGVIVNNGGNIVGNAGGNIISDKGSGLVSDNGSGLISDDGSTLISDNGLGLISDKGVGFANAAGASLIAMDHATVIGNNGNAFGINGTNVLSHNGAQSIAKLF